MRKISANYIFPVSGKPIKNGIIIVDDEGTILDVVDSGENFREIAGLEHYSGILVPGLINTHCHLELSYLKSKLAQNLKLEGFIEEIQNKRNQEKELAFEKASKHDYLMEKYGIVAVADICNDEFTFKIKSESKIEYHNFIEIFGTNSARASGFFEKGILLQKTAIEKYGLSAMITPHAPYSISPALFRLINDHTKTENQIITIHNQESKEENQLFISKSGKIFDKIKSWGVDPSDWYPRMDSSVAISVSCAPAHCNLLLVHNTYTSESDLKYAENLNKNIFWVMCPNANLYIENQLPDLKMFRKNKAAITIGTDSLASNHTLSILEEMKTLQKYFPEIPLEEIITWATLNGARALKSEHRLGSFEPGKKPGICLIENIDLKGFLLKENSIIKRMI
ncbi:MAG: hypothetical protein A2W91_00525 [Bacteroidetes bacterium GWF2_38_335]|nr:MAG: hypothetical protein A2W91_00525 [Bacteroidetes bacterium GWF2_38_335]OFY78317.1 MAG: hypothetical protein A2281_03905 [Bacteroidetes bacterium RIFOXYA12_FULL_38_20]HBS87487.1 hypothetical protein [Bacteroidales bacterium]